MKELRSPLLHTPKFLTLCMSFCKSFNPLKAGQLFFTTGKGGEKIMTLNPRKKLKYAEIAVIEVTLLGSLIIHSILFLRFALVGW
ncbi:hypothetical protein METP2_02944 [Methanosarcinales archaeon]|nr:hypothetical protein METP2_02944 [Methanosarcinales archaeon]